MSFRKIRPSLGDNSASTSDPYQSPSESMGSGQRRNCEKEAAENSTRPFKRRRAPGSVTQNACLGCKKARAKCDGSKPCKRCVTRRETSGCIYEVHIKHAKEELVKEIKELKVKDHLTGHILQALSTDEKVPDILGWLKHGETYQSIVEWLGRAPMDEFETLSPRESRHSAFEGSDHEMSGVSSTSRWTSVTSDTVVLDHLFQLYFAWVHPVHTLFSEDRFADSYKRQLDNYCSSVLVNAICAMACHLSSAAEADETDLERLGGEFSDAVCANIDPGDKKITTVQAFAVMFLVDCARANSLRASSYLRVATNSLAGFLCQESDGFAEVWKNTVRGVQNLNIEWAQVTFQAPPTINSTSYDGFEGNDNEQDSAKWYFHRYVNDQCPAWPGLFATTNQEKTKLTAIIRDVTTMMYTRPGPQISARHLLHQYGRLMTWREELPSVIGNTENDSQALPHVLSLLILYSNTVILLLRPLLDFEGFPSSLVKETIWSHAQQGLFLLDEHYRTQYTCRYQPVLQMFAVLHLTDIIARFFPGGMEGGGKDGFEAVQFGMEVLTQSRVGFPIASTLQEMLRRTSNECSIRLSWNPTEFMAIPRPPKVYRMDDFLDACTRPTYTQPIDQIHLKYVPSFSSEWAIEGSAFGFLEPSPGTRSLGVSSAKERDAQSLLQIRNLLNTN
ncbi:hypothetical protein BKA64DRAFT_631850 [Cadophora sp. MPI-SDFR-AT-0126]|nr:hypothetical protein BKA64DRAFT_631850 [Leotiomycetes sp. MPI-SDFR-AT-0126]